MNCCVCKLHIVSIANTTSYTLHCEECARPICNQCENKLKYCVGGCETKVCNSCFEEVQCRTCKHWYNSTINSFDEESSSDDDSLYESFRSDSSGTGEEKDEQESGAETETETEIETETNPETDTENENGSAEEEEENEDEDEGSEGDEITNIKETKTREKSE